MADRGHVDQERQTWRRWRRRRRRVSALDFEYFRTRVQPIFLAKRPGHARCITCHETGQPRLVALPEGVTTWTDEQSRQNFEAWQRVVVPGDPNASRLLMHPLAKQAGGDPFHAGGKHWQSRERSRVANARRLGSR